MLNTLQKCHQRSITTVADIFYLDHVMFLKVNSLFQVISILAFDACWHRNALIHLVGPQSRPVVITIFVRVVCTSVRPSPLFKFSQKKTSENNVHYWGDCGPGRVDHWWPCLVLVALTQVFRLTSNLCVQRVERLVLYSKYFRYSVLYITVSILAHNFRPRRDIIAYI